jgi:hypothetical protein
MDVRLDESPSIVEFCLDSDVLGLLFLDVLRSEDLQLALLQRRLGVGSVYPPRRR